MLCGTKLIVMGSTFVPPNQRTTKIKELAILDAATLELQNTVSLKYNQFVHMAVTPDGQRAMVSDGDVNTVTVVDLQDSSVVATVPVGNGAEGVAVAGNLALVANSEGGTVSAINLNNLGVVQTVDGGPGPSYVSIGGNTALVTITDYESRAEYVVLQIQ